MDEQNKLKALFLAAVELATPEQRVAYLDEFCGGDADLRQRVEQLLHADNFPDSVLDAPLLPPASTPLDAERKTEALPSAELNDEIDLSYLEPPCQPNALGRLGHYQILEVVGKGGMGVVLRGFDEKLHRVVAIKVMAAELAASATARKRFIREAQAAAAVTHEHVVAIHAIEEEHRPPYIVMQFVDGMSLQEKLDQSGPLELKEVLRIGMQIAEGLADAHKQGLVHRDIKPANILLENGVERVKITDFGLARAVDDASITQSGVIAGTPMYMSPEQAAGELFDHRSDLFSLGSVLYAMCTGRPPFRATTTMAVLKRVVEDTPRPIGEINPEVPDWLEAIVAKLHAKKPDDRFQSAKEVADLLGQHLAHLQQPSVVPRPQPICPPVTMQSTSLSASKPIPSFSWWRVPVAVWIGLVLLAAIYVVALLQLQHHIPPERAQGIGTLLNVLAAGYLTLYGGLALLRRNRTSADFAGHLEPRPWRIALFLGLLLFFTSLFTLAWVQSPWDRLQALLYTPPANCRLIVEVHDPLVTVLVNGKPGTVTSFANETKRLFEWQLPPGFHDLQGDKHEKGSGWSSSRKVLLKWAETKVIALTPPSQSTRPLAVAPFDAAKAKAYQDAWARHLGVEPEITNSIGMELR